MFQTLKTTLTNSAPTFLGDMAGCVALFALLYLGLVLPGLS
jgi:hypothetical protein